MARPGLGNDGIEYTPKRDIAARAACQAVERKGAGVQGTAARRLALRERRPAQACTRHASKQLVCWLRLSGTHALVSELGTGIERAGRQAAKALVCGSQHALQPLLLGLQGSAKALKP